MTIARDGSGIVSVTGVSTPSFTVTLAGSGVLQYGGNPARVATSVIGHGVVIPG